jgi:nucleotide-binding universal stress UspA family protein
MPRILVPFSDFASGERAVRRLIARARDRRVDVELLAVVDPLTAGKVAVFVSRAHAEAQARHAAQHWLRELEARLDAAGIAHRSSVAVGHLRDILKREGARPDIDEVVLGSAERDVLRGMRRRLVAHAMARPLVSVS